MAAKKIHQQVMSYKNQYYPNGTTERKSFASAEKAIEDAVAFIEKREEWMEGYNPTSAKVINKETGEVEWAWEA